MDVRKLETQQLIDSLVHSLNMRDWEDEPDTTTPRDWRFELRSEIIFRGMYRGDDVVTPLMELLTNRDWAIRSDVIGMLGRLKAQPAIPILIEMLKQGNDWPENILTALEEIGTPEALDAVKDWRSRNEK
jgi:HEAT repeat protein